MATPNKLKELKDIAEEINSVDENRLFREEIGKESLKEEFSPRLKKIRNHLDFVVQYAEEVHDNHINSLLNPFREIKDQLNAQAGRSNADYITSRVEFLRIIDEKLENLKLHWFPFVSAAIQTRGFLEDEGVRREYEKAVTSMKEETQTALQQVKEEANRTIEEARALAEQIEKRARKTAAKISVEEAQEQFKEAQISLDKKVVIWARISVSSIIVFLIMIVFFMLLKLPADWHHIIYHSALRITILTAIGAAAAFCLKMLRAHMHMSEKNRHRQRVANSIAAFVDSAITPEQRDLILSQLVDAVISFGNSGLLQREDDNIYTPKLTIDNIARNLTSSPAKD